MGNANLLLAHGSAGADRHLRPADAGGPLLRHDVPVRAAGRQSSLADITTRAEPQDDGTYRLTGTKMWISAGDHELAENIVHLVLAKIPGGPPGVKGISLFVVPKVLVDDDGSLGERNDVVLAGLNHKMGYRGTTNTLLNFGEGVHTPGGRAGAVGYLVGEQHQRPGLHVPHDERGADRRRGRAPPRSATPATCKSLDVRPQPAAGPPGRRRRTRAAPQVPIIEHADVRRMLLAAEDLRGGRAGARCSTAPGWSTRSRPRATEADRERAHLLLDMLTPIAKSWPSQWCLEANDLAIQVHGGYGYTRDYDVEQHYRDNRLNPIHEGTHGIQALDLLGRKVDHAAAAPALALLLRDDAGHRRPGLEGGRVRRRPGRRGSRRRWTGSPW